MSIRGKKDLAGEEETLLPPGKRDLTGFWFPLDCGDPSSLVSRRARRLRARRKSETTGQESEPEGP